MLAILQECPSLWRIYVYVQAGDQERILKARKEKKDLRLGQGGEGYIADDEWCYNCGGAGHWGDVSEAHAFAGCSRLMPSKGLPRILSSGTARRAHCFQPSRPLDWPIHAAQDWVPKPGAARMGARDRSSGWRGERRAAGEEEGDGKVVAACAAG
ncbi:hypothetical protein B0H11DRAFT_142322 [Mycena galericulata]|nr:hypothetical protein B0H11DRAFT_142322 [Mycena galericulata]